MKTLVFYLLMLMAIVVGVYRYNQKFEVPGTEARMVATLYGVHQYLKPGAAIRFVTFVAPDGTNTNNAQLVNNFVNYVMAPVSLNQQSANQADTTLIMAPIAMRKRVEDSISRAAHVVWQNADAEYYYALIH